MRARLYVRVSTERQETDQQEHALIEAARLQGWEVIETVREVESSGKRRPAKEALLERLNPGEVLLVYSLDRFARSSVECLMDVTALGARGVHFRSVRESAIDTTTPMGKFMLAVLAAVAELEREMIRSRVRAGLERVKRNGSRSGRPIGRPRQEIDVREAKQLLIGAGMTLQGVAEHFGVSRETLRRRLAQNPAQDATP